MKLFVYNERENKAELLDEFKEFECFKKLERRLVKGPGDHDGRKKLYNTKEITFVYFMGYFDSPFLLYEGQERVDRIKMRLGLPDEWIPDDVVNECIEVYKEEQRTESWDNYVALRNLVEAQIYFINDQAKKLKAGSIKPRDAKELQAFIKESNNNVRYLNDAKRLLVEEHSKKQTGKGGRELNEYELNPPSFVNTERNEYVD